MADFTRGPTESLNLRRSLNLSLWKVVVVVVSHCFVIRTLLAWFVDGENGPCIFINVVVRESNLLALLHGKDTHKVQHVWLAHQ